MNWWIFRYAENMLDSCVQRIWATIQCPDDSQWQAEYAEVNSEACFFNIFISELNNDSSATAGKLLRALNWVEWLAKYMTKCQFLVTLKSRGMDQQKHHEVQEWWNHKIMYFWRDLLKLSSPDPQFRQSQTVCFQRVFLLQAEQYQLSG